MERNSTESRRKREDVWSETVEFAGKTFVLRNARMSDYEAVMAMSEGVYDGLDYLPVQYFVMAHDPRVRMYVAECDGKVMSFQMTLIVDKQHSHAVHGSSRTHPEFAGINFTKFLFHPMTLMGPLHRAFPDVKHHLMVPLLKKHIDPGIGLGIVSLRAKWRISAFESNKIQLRTSLRAMNNFRRVNITSPSKSELARKLAENAAQLFPDGYMIYGNIWIPLEVNQDSINQVIDHNKVFATTSKDGKRIEAVTFLYTFLAPHGTVVTATHYSCCYDEQMVTSHFLETSSYAFQVAHPKRKMFILFHFPLGYESDVLFNFANDHKLANKFKGKVYDAYTAGTLEIDSDVVRSNL